MGDDTAIPRRTSVTCASAPAHGISGFTIYDTGSRLTICSAAARSTRCNRYSGTGASSPPKFISTSSRRKRRSAQRQHDEIRSGTCSVTQPAVRMEKMVPGEGFEPPTFGLQIRRFVVDNHGNPMIPAVKIGKIATSLEVSNRHSTRHVLYGQSAEPRMADNQAIKKQGWKLKRTKQCKKCPWLIGVDPHDIPNGYTEGEHRALENTIARDPIKSLANHSVMACRETHDAHCIGWLINQIGPGNNIGLRLRMISCENAGGIRLRGDQHATFEDTLP